MQETAPQETGRSTGLPEPAEVGGSAGSGGAQGWCRHRGPKLGVLQGMGMPTALPSPTPRQLQSPSWNLRKITGVSQGSPSASAARLSTDPALERLEPPQCFPPTTSTSSGASWCVGPAGTCPAWPPSLSLLSPALQPPLPLFVRAAGQHQHHKDLAPSSHHLTMAPARLPSPSCHHQIQGGTMDVTSP